VADVDPGGQLVEHVTADDEVVEVVTRAEMRRRGLRHRAVYVIVRTTGDGVVVHRRAGWKDVHPGWWDLCFGGVLGAGEDWDDAAVRELAEEAGVTAAVRSLGGGQWEGEGAAVVGRVYEAVHDGPFPCPDGEVVEVRVVPRHELAAFVSAHDVCPDSVAFVLPHLADP
jgi:8-oxo-dGTP pyrophosphatase MutT (NUDIX family)